MQGDHRWIRVLPPVLLCAALWGSAFPAIKTVYRLWAEQGLEIQLIDRWWFAGVRFVVAGLALLLVAKQPWAEIRAASKLSLIRFSLYQTAGQYMFFYWGMALASGSLAGLLVASGSFWWMLLAPLLAAAPWPTRRQWLAVAVGACGIVVATAEPGAGSGRPWLGAGLLILSTGLGSLGLIEFGKLRPLIGARAATGCSLFLGGCVLLLLGAAAFPRAAQLMTLPVLGLTLWLAIVSAAAFSLWNHLSTRHPVPLLAGYRFLIPLAGMLESLAFLPGESAGWGLWAGGVLIALSLTLAQRWSQPTAAVPDRSHR